MTNDLRPAGGRSVSGVLWSSVGVLTQGVGQFGVLAVLARSLTAAEFGVASASLIVIGLGKMVTTEGIVGPALTQRRDLTDDHIKVGFALSVIAGVATTALLWLAAPGVAALFHMPSLLSVTRVLSLVFLVQMFSVVPLALLQRERRFRRIATAEAVSFACGFAPLGIGFAVAGAGVWSIVAAYLGQSVLYSLLMLLGRPHPVGLRMPWSLARGLLFFGGGHTTGRYLNFVALQGDFFVVGRYMSEGALGIYGRAYQLATTPGVLLGGVLDRVLFPTFAGRRAQPDRLARDFRRAVTLTVMCTAPVSVATVVLAPELVRVVLGPGWWSVVVPFQVLSVTLSFRTAYKISDALAKATGAVYARAWRQAVYAAMVVGGALFARPYGIEGVAVAVGIAISVNYLLMSGLSLRLTGLKWRDLGAAHLPGLLLAAIGGAALFGCAAWTRGLDMPNATVVGSSALGGILAVALAAKVAPRWVVGPDARWLLEHAPRRRRTAQ